VQLELPTFAELAETSSKGHEVRPCDRYAQSHRRLGDIIDTVLVKAETVWLIWSVDEMYQILPLALCKSDILQITVVLKKLTM
jgi:hypothetical protein